MMVLPRSWPAVIGALLLVWLPTSCGNQKEGERCDGRNFDADCDDGLVCRTIMSGAQMYGICCPPASAVTDCIQLPPINTGGSADAASEVSVDVLDANAEAAGPDASVDTGATE
jgi:hypothetical protein